MLGCSDDCLRACLLAYLLVCLPACLPACLLAFEGILCRAVLTNEGNSRFRPDIGHENAHTQFAAVFRRIKGNAHHSFTCGDGRVEMVAGSLTPCDHLSKLHRPAKHL